MFQGLPDSVPEGAAFTPTEFGRMLNKGPATMHRWLTKGVRGHKLGSFWIGGRRMIGVRNYRLWLAAINGERPLPSEQLKARRAREIEAAERELMQS